VDLLADEPAEASPLSDAERLHQLPASVVGAADVADLAGTDQVVEGGQRLVKGRLAVPLVDLVQVDAVSAQPPQAGLTFADQVVAGQPGVVGPLPHRHARLGGHQHLVAAALQDLPQDLL
jgi:hypothetical protein